MKFHRIFFFISICLLIFQIVSAQCTAGQIDVNSASKEELQIFTGIGPVKAQAIIDARPFDSVDDLIKVYGIGPVTLQNMKNEGACVASDKKEELEKENGEEDEYFYEEVSEKKAEKENPNLITGKPVEEDGKGQTEIIMLNPPKTGGEISSKGNSNKYGIYALLIFLFLIAILFILRNGKNEKLV